MGLDSVLKHTRLFVGSEYEVSYIMGFNRVKYQKGLK